MCADCVLVTDNWCAQVADRGPETASRTGGHSLKTINWCAQTADRYAQTANQDAP